MARAGAAVGRGDLVEREPELEQLDRAIRDALLGRSRAIFLEGAPGIGKTALLDATVRRGQKAELHTLAARGDELERHFPFGVARQLFEPALRRATPAERRALLSGPARIVAPLVGGEDEHDRDSRPSTDTAFAFLHGLYWLTVNLAERTPLLIGVDDVHWSDAPSLRFLIFLCGRLEGIAVSLVVSARSGRPPAEPDLVAALASGPHVEVLTPGGLSEVAVADVVAARLGCAPAAQFAHACHEATGGVPFLVHELAAALADDGIAPTADNAGRVESLGPHTVARATLARLGSMSSSALALARAIAVLGGDARLPRAARLAGLGDSAALPSLDGLVQAHVLEAGAALRFAHPILRSAIYEDLAPGARSELHRRAARLLAEEGAELDAVAAQLLASDPSGAPEVARQLRAAATHALSHGAPEDASAYLSRALEEGCERDVAAAMSFELASAKRFAGQSGTAYHFREAHRLADDPELRNRAVLELATVLTLRGEWDRPMALVEDALADLGDRAPELATRLETYRAATAVADPRLVEGFDRRLPALHDLSRRDTAPARSLTLLLSAVKAWRGEGSDDVVSLVDRGWDAAPTVLANGEDLWALGQGLSALVIDDELDSARSRADVLLAEARARGSLTAFHLTTGLHGWIEARSGRLSTAEEELRMALEPARTWRLNFILPSQLWFATDVMLERPQARDLAAATEEVELGPMAGAHSGALLLDVRGRIRHASGDTAAAIADLRGAGEIFAALRFRNPNASSWRSALALMLGEEDRREAHRLVADELADAREFGKARGVGVALRALGLLAGGPDGLRHLEDAVSTLEQSQARLEHARALVDLGAARRRAGERAAARPPLRQGLDLAMAGGATALVERARSELAASGARPRRLRMSGRDALTPSELRVARLAAEGRTNNAVAQALFVTPKTVDTHLSRAYAKLGISSRQDLGAALEASVPAASDDEARSPMTREVPRGPTALR